jgi:hypothetical protein
MDADEQSRRYLADAIGLGGAVIAEIELLSSASAT